jgi:uncharacterized protein (DUF305 family)
VSSAASVSAVSKVSAGTTSLRVGNAAGPAGSRLEPAGPRRVTQFLLLAVVGLLALVTAAVVGYAVAGPQPPGDASADAGFARDMAAHHAQAVDMAEIIRGRTTDPAVRTLATDIALTQTEQMGEMHGWLAGWGLSYGSTRPPMAWMDAEPGMGMHGDSGTAGAQEMHLLPDGRMPGMATQAQVNRLRTLPPAAADRLFLQLMITHHRAGVEMAQLGADLAETPQVATLAASIVTAQQTEITQMRQMLSGRAAS